MRTNYPKDYLERCQADMASKAGAVAIAKAVEVELAKFLASARKRGAAEGEKSEVAATTDGATGKSGIEESKEARGDAGQQSPDITAMTTATATATATATTTGETSPVTNQARPVGESA